MRVRNCGSVALKYSSEARQSYASSLQSYQHAIIHDTLRSIHNLPMIQQRL